MKFTKKLFAAALALCLMLCLSIPAFADESTGDAAEPNYLNEMTIGKVYTLVGEGTSPQETFRLIQDGDGQVVDGEPYNVPALTISPFSASQGAANKTGNVVGSFTVTFPKYEKVGKFEYTLKEQAGSKAGVDYHSKDIKLVVLVVNGVGDDTELHVKDAKVYADATDVTTKNDAIENTYSAGTLRISKTVKGNLGDKSKYFDFKVTLKGVDGKEYADSYAVTGASLGSNNPTEISVDGQEMTFHLKDGDTISIANLPYGVTYTVTEDSYAKDGYATEIKVNDVVASAATGTINAAEQTAAFTNTKTGTLDMGVTLDNLPYILVLVAVLGGAVVMFTRKRRFED